MHWSPIAESDAEESVIDQRTPGRSGATHGPLGRAALDVFKPEQIPAGQAALNRSIKINAAQIALVQCFRRAHVVENK